MSTDLSVPQVLRAAADVLNNDGWAIGHLTCEAGTCALGAIAVARGWLKPYHEESPEDEYDYDAVWGALANDPAVQAVSDSILLDYKERNRSISKPDIPNTNRVYRWNDTFALGKEEVIQRFLKVAEEAERAENVS